MYRTHALCNGLGIENNLRDLLEASREKNKQTNKKFPDYSELQWELSTPTRHLHLPFQFYLHYNSVYKVFFLLPFFHAEGIS